LRHEPYAPAGLAEPELAIALCHRDGKVREAALQQAVGYPVLLPLAVDRCADRVGQVRERARELPTEALDAETGVALAPLILLSGRQDGVDPLPLYRAWCAAPEPVPGAVTGLAECGGRADAELLWTLVGRPTGAVRARAVAGLRVLDVADVRRLRPLPDDPVAGVVREVTAALSPSAEPVPEEWLTERPGAGWPRPVRVAAFRLLDARGGGVRREVAEALLDDPDVKLRGWAAHAVKRG